MQFLKKALIVILGAFLSSMALPGYFSSITVWFGFGLFLFCIRREKIGKAVLFGFIYGITYFLFGFGWIVSAFVREIPNVFETMPPAVGFLIYILLCLFESLFFALYGLIFSVFRKKIAESNFLFVILSVITLLSTELLRAFGPMGFTGVRFSDTFYNHQGLLQLNSLIGPYGMLSIIVIVNSLFAIYLDKLSQKNINSSIKNVFCKNFMIFFLPIMIIYLSDSITASFLPPVYNEETDNVNIVAVQSMTPAKKKHYSSEEEFIDDFIITTESIYDHSESEIDLIVFPEAYFMYDVYSYGKTNEKISEFSEKHGVNLAVPSLAVIEDDYYNAVRFVTPHEGVSENFYGKMKLNPFTEFLPFEEIFGFLSFLRFARFLENGEEALIFNQSGLNIAFPICFEAFYPEVFEKFNNSGADTYIVVTNDGYFDNYTALIQHFSQLNFRAVENRSWILHVSNNGITSLIDPYGRVVKSIRPFTQQNGFFSIPVQKQEFTDTYSDYRTVFLISLCIIIVFFYVFLLVIK